MVKVAVIGGSGVYSLVRDPRQLEVETPYGKVTEIYQGEIASTEIIFIPRHGRKHTLPPHRINYRANIAALENLGVERVIATSAVGSMHTHLEPGRLLLIDQFVDFTKNRQSTFYDGNNTPVVHVDMTEPYCPEIRGILLEAGKELGYDIIPEGTYICVEGPRYETPAEINLYRNIGGDVVGMTGVPEVVLAREKCMCYASIALITNWAAGISRTKLTTTEVLEIMKVNFDKIKTLLQKAIPKVAEKRTCECSCALDNAVISN